MKENSAKLLLLLHPGQAKPVSLPYQAVPLLLPELTPGGRRSLIHHLEAKGLLLKEKVLGQTRLSLSSQGRRELSRSFPALSQKWDTWTGSFEILVFLKPPKGDPQFRYLRKLLVAEWAMPINRGVYAAAGTFSERVLNECESLYAKSVLIFSVKEWKLGAERELLLPEYGISDVVEGYSGISREINELLEICKSNVRPLHQQILSFTMVFDRFWEIIADDAGFARFYYPQSPSAQIIINELQQLAECILQKE